MSTVVKIPPSAERAFETLNDLQRERDALRQRAVPLWSELRDDVPVSPRMLNAVESPPLSQIRNGQAINQKQLLCLMRDPPKYRPGETREVITSDVTGRKISRFYGDPEAIWGRFKLPAKRIVGATVEIDPRDLVPPAPLPSYMERK